jgi:hypothetical protein
MAMTTSGFGSENSIERLFGHLLTHAKLDRPWNWAILNIRPGCIAPTCLALCFSAACDGVVPRKSTDQSMNT